MTDNKTIHAASATHALPHKKKFKVESPVFKIVAYLFLLCFTAGVLVPFYVVIATSITEYTEIMSTMEFIWWPDKVSFESYISLLGRDRLAINGVPSLLRGFFNTMWIVVPSMLLNLFSSGLAAYAYSKLRFKAKKVMYGIMLATMVIPGAALTMPSYLYYDALGWTHTVLPMMIPGMLGGAGTVFFLRQFFSGIPNDLVEAAKLDGMGYFKIYVRIIMPLAVPAFLAQGIFAFVGGYNNYMGPMLYVMDQQKLWPLQLVLAQMQAQYGGYQNVQCASAVIALVPLMILYICAQRFFIEGVAAAGVKG